MTHILDTSAVLALLYGEAGDERVEVILSDPETSVGISTLTLFEVFTSAYGRTRSLKLSQEASHEVCQSVSSVIPTSEAIVQRAIELRTFASARIATVDCLIAATASLNDAVLVHRDPHFSALRPEDVMQERLPDKV